ncbi:hypothetical protein TRVA0_033S00430 [Trichomonascus vanleenenianus]|uniref:Yra2p n=1 Tax=Trichomonascus vanleenenianus TaxID=2268995 RepID=UPI003ECA0CC8
MDKSLDEIIAGKVSDRGHGGRVGKRHARGRDRRDRRDRNDSERRKPRGSTIMISNLFYSLNENDLEGLFGQVGPTKSIKIQYDRSGRSEGYAWVTFENSDDAHEAIRRFNGKPAAGQPITIVMAHGYFHERFKGNDFSQRLRRPRRDWDRGSNPPKAREERPKTSKRRIKTAEELDAELDAYMTGDAPSNTDEAVSTEPSTSALKANDATNEMVVD